MKKLNNNGFTILLIVIVALGITIIGGVGYGIYKNESKNNESSNSKTSPMRVRTPGTKLFEDTEHSFSFEYPDGLELYYEKLWVDKPQGGLKIMIYKQGAGQYNSQEKVQFMLIENAVARIEVSNRDLYDDPGTNEMPEASNKKTKMICGQKATTYTLAPSYINMYVTDFRKANLDFSIATDPSDPSRKAIHDSIVSSFSC